MKKLFVFIAVLAIIISISLFLQKQTNPSSDTPNTPTPKNTPSLTIEDVKVQEVPWLYQLMPHNNISPKEFLLAPQYWNTNWDANELYEYLISTNALYYKQHTYIEGVFDCSDMAVEIWNILYNNGVISILVVGNLATNHEQFLQTDHVWLQVIHKDTTKEAGIHIFFIEPTNGETYAYDPSNKEFFLPYVQGYYYSSPSNLIADVGERW